MPGKRLQVALEYMIIFAFVLVVFLFLFALVASQRAQTSSSQLYSQEQLIAQSVATQIDTALRAGNGYTARVSVTGAIGTLAYQLLITKNGGVIVNATVGNQALQAFAFSTARNVLSKSSYLQANTFYYNLPIANGTLVIQNSFGTICVDYYSCPNSSTQAANVSLSSQVVHAATFGGNSYISIPYSSTLSFPATTSFSWGAWAAMAATPYRAAGILGTIGGNPVNYALYFTNTNKAQCELYDGTTSYNAYSGALSPSKWYSIMCTYTGASGKVLSIYVNGVLAGSTSVGAIGTITSTSAIGIGTTEGTGPTRALNSSVSNAQIYNIALSSSQAMQLYQAGIAGQPVVLANIVGWWPLNGNANDYSGNGDNGAAIGPLLYLTAAELFAKVANQAGYALANAIVGFTTTLGVLNGNQIPANQVYTNYTNANGIATAFLTQQGSNGQAFVRATAYNGNTALAANLVGWWPLGEGQGNVTYDVSGNGNSGSMLGGTGWGKPNYVAGFDGNTTYIAPTNTPLLQPSSITYSAWIYPTYAPPGSGACSRVLQDGSDGGGGWEIDFDCQGSSAATTIANCAAHTANGWSGNANSPSLLLNNWYMLTCQYNSATGVVSAYLNGVLVATNTIGGGVITYGSAAVPYIGVDDAKRAQQFFYGRIANAQVYNSLLSAAQIGQLYQEGVPGVPVTSSGLVGWWPLSSDARDYGGNGFNGTIYGRLSFVATQSSFNVGNNATGALAVGVNAVSGGSFVSIPLSKSLTITKNIAVSMWLIPSGIQASDPLEMNSGCNGYTMFMRSTGSMGFSKQCQSFPSTVAVLQANTLYNVVGTYDGSTFKTYVNGVFETSLSLATTFNDIGPLQIGLGQDGGYKGNVMDVQIYNATLTANQTAQIYSAGPAGAPLSNSSLVGWWPLNGNANDYSGHGNNGTTTNVIYSAQRVTLPAVPAPFAGTGVNFNGQSGYIGLGSGSGLSSFSSGITLSAWVRFPSTGRYTILSNNGGNNNLIQWQVNNQGSWLEYSVNSLYYTTGTQGSMTTNAWHFLVVTYNPSSDTAYQYIDSVQLPSTSTGAASPRTFTGVLTSGRIGNGCSGWTCFFNGTISDVQVYNGILSSAQVTQLYQGAVPQSAYAVIPLSWFP